MTPRQLFRLKIVVEQEMPDLVTTDFRLLDEIEDAGLDPAELAERLKADFERLFEESEK